MISLRSVLHAYRPLYRALTVGVAATLFVVLVLQGLPFISRAELSAYDYQFSLRGGRAIPSRVVVVAVDQTSLNDLNNGRYPPPRQSIGRAIDFLHRAGASAIGLDFLYAAPSQYGSADDRSFAAAIKRAHNVVLAEKLEASSASTFVAAQLSLTPPIDVLARNAAGIGPANVPLDEDGAVRQAELIQAGPSDSGKGVSLLPSFPLALAQTALHRPASEIARSLGDTLSINYVGPQDPGDASKQSFHTYQFEAVARGEDPARLFRNKIVLIIPASLDAKDILNTPFGPMYGGYVQASTLDTILTRAPISPIGSTGNSILVLLLGLITAFVASRFGIWRSASATAVVAFGFAALVFLLFDLWRISVHVITPELAVILTFASVMSLRFATEERQKRRTAKIFGQYVKPEIVDILVNSPDEVAALAGVRRDISILFVDIRGFTSMSEHMEPEAVVAVLDIYLEVLTSAVLNFDGTINKYIGDEIVAIWNAPHHHPDHHLRAVKCGLEMVARLDEINARLHENGLPAIRYGVGINSGEAIVGEMGSPFRKQYDVIGDTVNTGARLCSAAGGGEVIIGQRVWESIGDTIVVEETEPLRLKGKSEGLRTFLVLDLQRAPVSAAETPPIPAPEAITP